MSGEPWVLGKLTRKRQDGSTYWSYCLRWVDDGGPHRVSLGTTSRTAAEAQAREFWTKHTLASADTIGQIMEAYLDSHPSDETRKRHGWKAAKEFWSALRIDQIDEHTSKVDYPAWRNRAANTMRNELGAINSGLKWALANRLIPSAPSIVLPAMPESEVEHLSRAQFKRFLKGCKAPHVILFAKLAIATGARCSALLELPWIRVDFDREQINLNPLGRIQKDNKRRATVPMTKQLKEALLEAQECAITPFVIESGGDRIHSIKKGFEAASKRSGVRCTPHMLRHSAAVWMAEDRTPMEEIATYLGHKNTNITTRVYARFHPGYLRRAARSLTW
jgi:integrase